MGQTMLSYGPLTKAPNACNIVHRQSGLGRNTPAPAGYGPSALQWQLFASAGEGSRNLL